MSNPKPEKLEWHPVVTNKGEHLNKVISSLNNLGKADKDLFSIAM